MYKISPRQSLLLVAIVAISATLSACIPTQDTTDRDSFTSILSSARNENGEAVGRTYRSQNGSQQDNGRGGLGAAGTELRGTGKFIGKTSVVSLEKTEKGEDGVTLNFRNAPIAEVAKKVLGDILNLNYSLSDQVNTNITIQTNRPIARDELAQVFESALAANGFAITSSEGLYQIVPSSSVGGGIRISSTTPKIGQGTQIVALRHVSATKMVQLLEPVAKTGTVLLANDERDVLILTGNARELSAMSEMIELFDVDQMEGMSFAFYPVEISDPQSIVKELNAVFNVTDGGGENSRIRFIPNDRLGAILVISKNPRTLDKARSWIRRLEQAGSRNEQNLFVYKIQNRPAEELADVLQRVLTNQSGSDVAEVEDNVAPRYGSSTISADVGPEPDDSNTSLIGQAVANTDNGNGDNGRRNISFRSGSATVVADVANNALLIHATRKEYQRILQIAKNLDILPTQVMLEAVIAEVSLNDDLKFGLKWYFNKHGGGGFGFTDAISGAVESTFPGFSYLFASNEIRVVLDALSEITTVNVVSSPSLMVLDNRTATLQIGDQVPIVTRTGRSTDTPDAPIINNIELKDTGVIFNVTPRVNDNGRVVLEIEQEVSNVVPTTTSGIDSPTIEQRRIKTSVVVSDGGIVTLGGLIQQRDTTSKVQVPVLGNIPVLGTLFRTKRTGIDRTELLVFIRPIVVRNENESAAVTAEFRDRLNLNGLQETRGDRHYGRDLRRIFK